MTDRLNINFVIPIENVKLGRAPWTYIIIIVKLNTVSGISLERKCGCQK